MKLFILFVCVVGFENVVSQQSLDYFLGDCKHDTDEQVNQCVKSVFKKMGPYVKTGVPALNVPILEPVNLASFDFIQNQGSVNIDAKFSNVLAHGFSNHTIHDVKTSFARGTIEILITIPELRATGDYILNGNILLLPITGAGKFGAQLFDITATLKGNVRIINENGKERLAVQDTTIDFQLKRTRIKLFNLFNGDRILGDTVNHFLNENSQLIIDEIRPGVSRDLAIFVGQIIDAAYSVIPLDSYRGKLNAGRK